MLKKTGSLLAIAALLALGACSSRTDRSDGGVILSISDFDGLPVQAAVNSQSTIQIGSITIQNIPKNPSAGTTALMNVEMTSYEVVYSRPDGGTRVPPSLVQGILGVAPVNGTTVYNNLVIMAGDQFDNPPISDLLFVNGGTDSETGNQRMTVRFRIRFFGRSLTGDSVATEPATFDIEFIP